MCVVDINSRVCCLAAPGDPEGAARGIAPRRDNTHPSMINPLSQWYQAISFPEMTIIKRRVFSSSDTVDGNPLWYTYMYERWTNQFSLVVLRHCINRHEGIILMKYIKRSFDFIFQNMNNWTLRQIPELNQTYFDRTIKSMPHNLTFHSRTSHIALH